MKLSVILPIYNAEKYLNLCLDSLLNQTLRDFELICINDGSTDSSLDIIKSYASNDSRITIINRENKGLVYTLNEGIKLSKGKFIARMDADDICFPERFHIQIEEMEKLNLDFCGTSYSLIDERGEVIKNRFPPSSLKNIKSLLLFGSPFCHPSVIFNKDQLGDRLYYDQRFKHVEDLELWFRLIKSKARAKNINKILLKYRINSEAVSSKYSNEQNQAAINITSDYLNVNVEDIKVLRFHNMKRKKIHSIINNYRKLVLWGGFNMFIFSILYIFKPSRKYTRK